MGYISNKYDIPVNTVVALVRDGIVDWRIEGLWDFYQFYTALKKRDSPNGEVREEMMFHYNISYRMFYYYLAKAQLLFEPE